MGSAQVVDEGLTPVCVDYQAYFFGVEDDGEISIPDVDVQGCCVVHSEPKVCVKSAVHCQQDVSWFPIECMSGCCWMVPDVVEARMGCEDFRVDFVLDFEGEV